MLEEQTHILTFAPFWVEGGMQVFRQPNINGILPGSEDGNLSLVGLMGEYGPHLYGDHDSRVLPTVGQFLSQGKHGRGFTHLAGGVNHEVVLLVNEATQLGQAGRRRQHVVDVVLTRTSGVEPFGHWGTWLQVEGLPNPNILGSATAVRIRVARWLMPPHRDPDP